jgi:putative DNA methylase
MSQKFLKTKPSLMEAGLPCSSLSAECQRDNNSLRPPQNRLHIWWARRAPTVCRAAIVGGLLPHDVHIPSELLTDEIPEPAEEDIARVPVKYRRFESFYRELLRLPATHLTRTHRDFLRALGVKADVAKAYARIALAELAGEGAKIVLGATWGYRHPRAFALNPRSELVEHLLAETRRFLGLQTGDPVNVLDFMAGGGSIPLEAVRYGAKVYANDLNPVASLVLKATLEYPSRFGREILDSLIRLVGPMRQRIAARLGRFFPTHPSSAWWSDVEDAARRRFVKGQATNAGAGSDAAVKRITYLWMRVLPCTKCSLHIPLSTNLMLSRKGPSQAHLAIFPVVPTSSGENNCTFRIVPRSAWHECRWPRFDSTDSFDPTTTLTYTDGDAICPRCGAVIDGDTVKKIARQTPGGLRSQLYAVSSRVPVNVSYRNGDVKVRYLWHFRSPSAADLAAVQAAEDELDRNEGRWAHLIPTELVPEVMEDRRPREYGMTRWRDFFMSRQLLTTVTILEEIRKAQAEARSSLPAEQAEAVAVYLGLMLGKVVDYNSVNTFWHTGSHAPMHTFSRHDFAFRPAFCEIDGAREIFDFASGQVTSVYGELADLIHGEAVSLDGGDDEGDLGAEDEVEDTDENDEEATASAETVTSAEVHLRPEVIVPTVTNNDAAALETPAPGTVHLICVDPPYYNNVQYSELSNFFYVWLKRALGDFPGLEPFFREELAETNREAVANAVRWKAEAEKEEAEWQTRFEAAFATLEGAKGDNDRKLTKPVRTAKAKEAAGDPPLTASERAERFYEAKMAAVFRRAKQLLHPAGRMVVMFNHKMTKAWRALGKALIEAGFEIRTSIPIHTEAESSLNIRGLDAARSTVLLLCLPREDAGQVAGNWGRVQDRITTVARNAAQHFQKQGIFGTDLYLSALGPALGEVGRHWPITDMAGRAVDVTEALDKAYAAVGQFRLQQILTEELPAKIVGMVEGFAADTADKNTQALWLWLDTFQGDVADSDDVRKLAKSLDIEPDTFKKLKLIESESDLFYLKPPQDMDLVQLARQQSGEKVARGRASREGDVWEERKFPNFLGAAVWNAISLLAGGDELHRGIEPLKRWLRASGSGDSHEFRGAYAVTLYLLEQAFAKRKDDDPWKKATTEARRGWDLVLRDWRG